MEAADFSLGGIWEKAGPFAKFIVYVLAFMSFVSFLVAVERTIVYLRSKKESLKLIDELGPLLERRDFAGATAKTSVVDKIGYLGRVVRAGLLAFNAKRQEHEDVAYESVTRALERQTQREIHSLRRGLTSVASVSSLAPFVGLLGTVVGIVNSFTEMAEKGTGGLATVSAGVAEALITTAFGLIVAIPALAIYNFLQGWVDARSVDMAETANELLDLVASELKKDAIAGHARVSPQPVAAGAPVASPSAS